MLGGTEDARRVGGKYGDGLARIPVAGIVRDVRVRSIFVVLAILALDALRRMVVNGTQGGGRRFGQGGEDDEVGAGERLKVRLDEGVCVRVER